MTQGKSVNFLDQEELKAIIRHLENDEAPEPDSIRGAPTINLGRIIELDREYLVVMPPNLAMRMPKKEGASLDSVRDQIISMVAMHIKVVGQD